MNLAAFELLVRSHQAELYRYARYLGAEPDAAAEAAVSALLSAREDDMPSVEPTGRAAAAWLRGVVGQSMLEEERLRRGVPTPFTAETVLAAEEAWQSEFLRSGDGFDYSEALQACLRELPDDRRSAVMMKYRDGRSRPEIGRVLSLSEEEVRLLMRGIRAGLTACVRKRLNLDAREVDDGVDRLVDALLREELGGEYPPNLCARTLERDARRRRMWWIQWASWTGAAVVAIALGAWWIAAQRYPPPALTGVELAPEQLIDRGLTITTEKQAATLTVGGYCTVKVAPESEVQWTGAPRAEEVVLNSGIVECMIEPDHGSFQVRTVVGVVSVAGTHFHVKTLGGRNSPNVTKKMYVKVDSGVVFVTGAWGNLTLSGGEDAVVPPPQRPEARPAAPPPPATTSTTRNPAIPTTTIKLPAGPDEPAPEAREGRTVGILANHGSEYLLVKGEGLLETRRYYPQWGAEGYDRKMMERFRRLRPGNLVEVEWTWDGHYRAKSVQSYVPPEKTGTAEGTVVGRSDRWLEIKPDGRGYTERYYVRWDGGGEAPDPRQEEMFSLYKKGDRVKVTWRFDDRKVITDFLRVAPHAQPVAPANP